MERRSELFKWLLMGVVALTMMAIALPGCGQEKVTPGEAVNGGREVPAEEEAGEAASVVAYQIAEADELRIELDSLLSIAVDTGAEVADYCDTFWETWRDGTKEEMLQLAEDHPRMVTKVAEAEAELNYAPTIIDKTEELDIPNWYQDYFSKKGQVADYLATAFQQAEMFLAGVEPMVKDMSDFISVGEGILDFWAEIMPEVGSLIDEERYGEARQIVTTWTASADDMQSLLIRAYGQAGVPVLPWMSDRCGSMEEVLILLTDWLEAKEAGNSARVEQVRSEIEVICYEELEILRSIPWDESNAWFETNFGAYIDQVRDSLGQVTSVNGEAELAYEAHWVPSEGGPIFDIGKTAATDDVHEQVLVETEEYNYWEEGDIVAGYPEIDIVGAHTREDGGNIVFWMEVVGPITDNDDLHYNFTVFAGTWEERILDVYYRNGEAEYSLPEVSWEYTPCEYYKSDTVLMILVPRDVVDMPAGWMVSVTAYEYRDIVWDETRMNILSGEFHQDGVLLEAEE